MTANAIDSSTEILSPKLAAEFERNAFNPCMGRVPLFGEQRRPHLGDQAGARPEAFRPPPMFDYFWTAGRRTLAAEVQL